MRGHAHSDHALVAPAPTHHLPQRAPAHPGVGLLNVHEHQPVPLVALGAHHVLHQTRADLKGIVSATTSSETALRFVHPRLIPPLQPRCHHPRDQLGTYAKQ
eukprot:2051957-Alexandrium_andersonii.AAC.1